MYLSFWHRMPFDLLIACGIGLLLDFCVGDPRGFPHPVRGIGWLIKKLELRLYISSHRRFMGCILLILTVFITCACAFLLLWIAGSFGRYVQLAVAAIMIWTTISVRDLFDHAEQVRLALQQGNLDRARVKLSAMVSRDTANLPEHEVARGCIESVAENLVDGIISPLFFVLLGGPVLAYAFKAISTLDSMVGYRNERYREFGWASARADDVLNFVPARILFITLPLAALAACNHALKCLQIMIKDGDKSPSPNSGIPEAGFAGALGIQLGGASTYGGEIIVKPCLNEEAPRAATNDIRRAQILLYSASLASFCLLVVVRWFGRWS